MSWASSDMVGSCGNMTGFSTILGAARSALIARKRGEEVVMCNTSGLVRTTNVPKLTACKSQ